MIRQIFFVAAATAQNVVPREDRLLIFSKPLWGHYSSQGHAYLDFYTDLLEMCPPKKGWTQHTIMIEAVVRQAEE